MPESSTKNPLGNQIPKEGKASGCDGETLGALCPVWTSYHLRGPSRLANAILSQHILHEKKTAFPSYCAGRSTIYSFDSITPPNRGASCPGAGPSRGPLARSQMLKGCPRGKFLRRRPPVLPPILKAQTKLPRGPLHPGCSLAQRQSPLATRNILPPP